ncbi:MAG: SGNH/GDSL hydrolase family protein [Streptosporangiaceae bacterium]
MRRVAVVVASTALAAAVVVAVVVLITRPTGNASPHHRRAAPMTSYYLALGDSLSRGVQPDPAGASVPTDRGYPDQLYGMLRPGDPGLRLVKLGCSGETTATMIHGGICTYPGGSQLAAAVRFLRAHRGRVALVTIDIGANDPNACITQLSLSKIAACVSSALPDTAGNLSTIMRALRTAGGRKLRVIGMSYYVPELAAWRDGPAGQLVARLAERLAAVLNNVLTSTYTAFGARVADVSSAFSSGDFTSGVTRPALGTVPRNVALVCSWTWACAPPPRGPNEHPNAAGYRVIASAFRRADLR